ncbi:putative GTP-binding protein EngB [Diplonema papillatum]|nr:putative GTP-binding protein EngB [Diplonema papillatum]
MKRVSSPASGSLRKAFARWHGLKSLEWERKDDLERVATEKQQVLSDSWSRRWAEQMERGSLLRMPAQGVAFSLAEELGAPEDQVDAFLKAKRGMAASYSDVRKESSTPEFRSCDEDGAREPEFTARESTPSGAAEPSADEDLAGSPSDLPGSEEDKFVDSEIMKMESRVLKAAARLKAREAMRQATQPSLDLFTFNNRLVPPPPNITNILVPSAVKMGDNVYVRKEFKLVYQGGPNDVYLDTGPNSASEVAFFGREGSGKTELLNALTEQRLPAPRPAHGETKSISFYQAPDPKLWKEAWSAGPTKYPAATRISKTHWGGMLVDLPGFPMQESRPFATDTFYQCVSQYYEGTRRQLKGTFYCIDATVGVAWSDMKWLKVLSEFHTRVSLVSIVVTKADLIPHEKLCSLIKRIYDMLGERNYRLKVNLPVIPTSSVMGWGIQELRGYVAMQAELLPWWKRVEEQRGAVENARERTEGEDGALLAERATMAEAFQQLDSWNTEVAAAVNASTYGIPADSREAEFALVSLEKQQKSRLGLYPQGMGARVNPLVRNKYLNTHVSGGGVLGPGIAPVTVEQYVAQTQPATPLARDAAALKLDELQGYALQYPSPAARHQKEFVERALGEWTDPRRGVEMFSPTFRTDPDITQKEWDSLSQEELEKKIVRTEAGPIERMRYGFDLDDIRDDVRAMWQSEVGSAVPDTSRTHAESGVQDDTNVQAMWQSEDGSVAAELSGVQDDANLRATWQSEVDSAVVDNNHARAELPGVQDDLEVRGTRQSEVGSVVLDDSHARTELSGFHNEAYASAAGGAAAVFETRATECYASAAAGSPAVVFEAQAADSSPPCALNRSNDVTVSPDEKDDIASTSKAVVYETQATDCDTFSKPIDQSLAHRYNDSSVSSDPAHDAVLRNIVNTVGYETRTTDFDAPFQPIDQSLTQQHNDRSVSSDPAHAAALRDAASPAAHEPPTPASAQRPAVPDFAAVTVGYSWRPGRARGTQAIASHKLRVHWTVRRFPTGHPGMGGRQDVDDTGDGADDDDSFMRGVPDAVRAEMRAAAEGEPAARRPIGRGKDTGFDPLPNDDGRAPSQFTNTDMAILARQVLKMKKELDGVEDEVTKGSTSEPSAFAKRLADAALQEPHHKRAGKTAEDTLSAAAEHAMGLPKQDMSAFHEVKMQGVRSNAKALPQTGPASPSSDSDETARHRRAVEEEARVTPRQKWKSFTELLNKVPSQTLLAAQPVHPKARLYKPEFSAPTGGGAPVKLDDGMGINNEPTLVTKEVIAREIKRKQMGPHYMGFPWMSHEQVPTAVAVHEGKKAAEMATAAYRFQVKAVALTQRHTEIGPRLIRPPSERALKRHSRELLEDAREEEKNKGQRRTRLVLEFPDEATGIMRYQACKDGKSYGPIARTPNMTLGESQGLPPAREAQLQQRLVYSGKMEPEELHFQNRYKGPPTWQKNVSVRRLITYAFYRRQGHPTDIKLDGRARVHMSIGKRLSPRAFKERKKQRLVLKDARQVGYSDKAKQIFAGASPIAMKGFRRTPDANASDA